MSKFAENLKDLMEEREIFQSQLAEALNVKQQTISRYVNGEREPNINIVIAIAKFFDVTTDFLLGLED